MENEKKESKILQVIGLTVIVLIAIIGKGLVLTKFWEWFISDYFDIKKLTIPNALGISLIFEMITKNYDKEKYKEKDKENNVTLETALRSILTLIFALLIGYIIYLFT